MSGLIGGILLPATVFQSGWFQVLAAFVGFNTVIYATLALWKLVPRRRA